MWTGTVCIAARPSGQRGYWEMTMLDQSKVGEVSARLVRHWNEGTRLDAIPEEMRPANRQEGYWIQSALMDTTAEALFGWKIAATSAAGQRHINVDGPLAGR